MAKDKIILNDNTMIEIEAGSSLDNLQIISPEKETMISTWGKFTMENLSVIRIVDGGGKVIGEWKELVLVSETSVEQEDGNILTSFELRKKTEIEKRMDALEEKVEVHDGAIMDTAEELNNVVEAWKRGDINANVLWSENNAG